MSGKILSFADKVYFAIKFVLRYIAGLLPTAIHIMCAYVITGLAAYCFTSYCDTDLSVRLNGLDLSGIGYALAVVACLYATARASYASAKRQLTSPRSKADNFTYYNGAVIGIISVLPFMIFCIVSAAQGYTYNATTDEIDLVRMLFCYIVDYPFSRAPVLDFSFLQYMLYALIPLAICAAAYPLCKLIYSYKFKKAEAAQ